MASATLVQIRNKVRANTQSASAAQLTDANIDFYVNTYMQCDMPTELKLFSLRTTLTFYTQPGQDVYQTVTTPITDPLFDFENKYTVVHQPIFIAGVQAFYTEEQSVFYANWPQTNAVTDTNLFGNGTPGPFTGVLPPSYNSPIFPYNQPHVLQRSVLFSCLDANGTAMNLVDTPFNNVIGYLAPAGEVPVAPYPYGQVNYLTGVFTCTFPANTGIGTAPVNNPLIATFINYAPGLPTTVLYYDNKFTVRPVPDKAYAVKIEADRRPIELLMGTDSPKITQWWQLIAWGAILKVFEDKQDEDGYSKAERHYLKQLEKVGSTAVNQYTEQRTVTMFTNNGRNNGWNNGFGRWPY